jgi:hypothetical protein
VTSAPPGGLWDRFTLADKLLGLATVLLALVTVMRPFGLLVLTLAFAVATCGLVIVLRLRGVGGRAPRARLLVPGTIFLALTLLLGVAATNTASNLLYLTTAAMLAFLSLSGVLSSLVFVGLRVQAKGPGMARAGEVTVLQVALENRKPALASYCVTLAAPPARLAGSGAWELGMGFVLRVPPRGRQECLLTVTPLERGWVRLPALRLSTRFPFGFLEKWLLVVPESESLIRPARGELLSEASPRTTGAAHQLGGQRRNPRQGEEDFRGLREYQPGDSLRLVHWRTSARTAELRVKDLEQHGCGRALITLCTVGARPADTVQVEHGVSFAATVLESLLRRGYQVDLVTDAGVQGSALDLEEIGGLEQGLMVLAEYPILEPAESRLAEALEHSRAAATGDGPSYLITWERSLALEELRGALWGDVVSCCLAAGELDRLFRPWAPDRAPTGQVPAPGGRDGSAGDGAALEATAHR